MPIFHNLTELKLGDLNVHGWESLPHLLESAPNLETLVFLRVLAKLLVSFVTLIILLL